jgi:hypothetical protein
VTFKCFVVIKAIYNQDKSVWEYKEAARVPTGYNEGTQSWRDMKESVKSMAIDDVYVACHLYRYMGNYTLDVLRIMKIESILCLVPGLVSTSTNTLGEGEEANRGIDRSQVMDVDIKEAVLHYIAHSVVDYTTSAVDGDIQADPFLLRVKQYLTDNPGGTRKVTVEVLGNVASCSNGDFVVSTAISVPSPVVATATSTAKTAPTSRPIAPDPPIPDHRSHLRQQPSCDEPIPVRGILIGRMLVTISAVTGQVVSMLASNPFIDSYSPVSGSHLLDADVNTDGVVGRRVLRMDESEINDIGSLFGDEPTSLSPLCKPSEWQHFDPPNAGMRLFYSFSPSAVNWRKCYLVKHSLLVLGDRTITIDTWSMYVGKNDVQRRNVMCIFRRASEGTVYSCKTFKVFDDMKVYQMFALSDDCIGVVIFKAYLKELNDLFQFSYKMHLSVIHVPTVKEVSRHFLLSTPCMPSVCDVVISYKDGLASMMMGRLKAAVGRLDSNPL